MYHRLTIIIETSVLTISIDQFDARLITHVLPMVDYITVLVHTIGVICRIVC